MARAVQQDNDTTWAQAQATLSALHMPHEGQAQVRQDSQRSRLAAAVGVQQPTPYFIHLRRTSMRHPPFLPAPQAAFQPGCPQPVRQHPQAPSFGMDLREVRGSMSQPSSSRAYQVSSWHGSANNMHACGINPAHLICKPTKCDRC